MFYLNQFMQICKKNIFLSLMMFLISNILIIGSLQLTNIEKSIYNVTGDLHTGPYFNVLISKSENHKRISRKLMNLPGVRIVRELKEEQIKQQVKTNLAGLQMNLDDFDLEYVGLKVFFKKGLELRSQTLIKGYLTRLVSRDKITIGATRNINEIVKKSSYIITHIRKWGKYVIYFFLVTLWLIVATLFLGRIKEVGYLVEQFQRKRNVSLKTAFIGFIGIALIGVFLGITPGDFDLINSLYVLPLFLTLPIAGMSKSKWQI